MSHVEVTAYVIGNDWTMTVMIVKSNSHRSHASDSQGSKGMPVTMTLTAVTIVMKK